MVNITKVSDNLKTWFLGQVDNLIPSNPAIKFAKPFLKRAVNKQFIKIEETLQWITNDEGDIDIDVLMDEIITAVKEPEVFKLDTKYVGEVEIGNGIIKLGIPMTDKNILFQIEDLEFLKEALIE